MHLRYSGECQARKPQVQFLKPLVWHSWGANPQTTAHEAHALSTKDETKLIYM